MARKGTILFKQEKYAEAIEALEKSLLEDNNSKVKDELNKIKKLKKEKEAKEYINPELADKHNEQGTALYKEGKYLVIQASSLSPSKSMKKPLEEILIMLSSTAMWAKSTSNLWNSNAPSSTMK